MFDPKVNKYLMNILVQILKFAAKTEHGNFTQIGILIYALFFGSTLLSIVKTVDISSLSSIFIIGMVIFNFFV